MAGPIPNFTPGYKASKASANRWADECQKVCLPSLSSHFNKTKLASAVIGLPVSTTTPLTFAAIMLRAKPSLMLCAT